jgi:hypothetical protein
LAALCWAAAVQADEVKPGTPVTTNGPAPPVVGGVTPPTVPLKGPLVGKQLAPLAPAKAGCYQHLPGSTAWTEVPCLSGDAAAHIPHGDHGPWFGQSLSPGSTAVRGNGGVLSIELARYGTETDSKYGANRFSLQLNANQFTGANGDAIGVQFLYNAYTYNGQQENVLDIQQNDATKQIYPPPQHPTSVPVLRNPQTGDVASLSATASGGNL